MNVDCIVENLTDIHEIVWRFRDKHQADWPTPNPRDSLLYAITEVGEAIDAHLRTERPHDNRNNARNLSVDEELADCLIMLLTAEFKPDVIARAVEDDVDKFISLEHLAASTARAAWFASERFAANAARTAFLDALPSPIFCPTYQVAIATLVAWCLLSDPHGMVERRLARIARKLGNAY